MQTKAPITFLLSLIIWAISSPTNTHAATARAVRLELAHSTVRPGERQTITIRGLPSVPYSIRVTMPDGEILSGPGKTNVGGGVIAWSFIQPPGSITRASRRAAVLLMVGAQTYPRKYTIAFSALDIVVPHRPVAENSETVLWFHARAGVRIAVQLSRPTATTTQTIVAGKDGWASIRTRIENDIYPFEPITVSVVASAGVSGGNRVARADFQVLPFQFRVSLGNVQLLHQVNGQWVQTTAARAGEEVRLHALAVVAEPAGNAPQCVSGLVTVVQSSAVVQSAPLQCVSGGEYNMAADFQLSSSLAPGAAVLEIDATFENAVTRVSVPVTVLASTVPAA